MEQYIHLHEHASDVGKFIDSFHYRGETAWTSIYFQVLFRSDPFLEFVRRILDLPALHRNIDPVGAVFVNIYRQRTVV